MPRRGAGGGGGGPHEGHPVAWTVMEARVRTRFPARLIAPSETSPGGTGAAIEVVRDDTVGFRDKELRERSRLPHFRQARVLMGGIMGEPTKLEVLMAHRPPRIGAPVFDHNACSDLVGEGLLRRTGQPVPEHWITERGLRYIRVATTKKPPAGL